MNKNIFNIKSGLSLLLITLMIFSMASCSGNKNDTAFLDQISAAEAYSEEEESTEVSTTPSTEEGYTECPEVKHILNTEPYSVIIAGTCENDANVKIVNVADDEEVYTTNSIGNYFIMEITLNSTTEQYYEISATVEGKEESVKTHFTAKYNAVAENPLDGSAVTLGNNSTLFFENLISAYIGENLLTNTELKEFKDKVSSATNKKDVKYVYVMVPGMLTVCEDKIPESIKKVSYNTKFEQICKALSEVETVDVINLTDAFMANREASTPLYYNTSGNLSDFGAYLTYKAICEYISSEAYQYKFDEVIGKGGNLVTSLGLDKDIFTEKYYYATKDFTTTIPEDTDCICPLSDVVIYEDAETNSYYTDTEDDTVFGACESLYFKTNRVELPSAIFLRDDTSNAMVSMLVQNFNNSYFEANDSFSLTNSTITKAISDYASEGNEYVDYVFVIISEDNIDSIISGN
ncbi:MAG: hypothetical protein E7614_05680 [Ruminococcaceae bacterium]|nr:hypothetical protein [Oscillospiraceae bacterium]